MTLRTVNLNLIPVLRALLKSRSVTGAAVVLNLSQSAVSDALQKLRHILKDQLLVRVGAETKLTPRAVELRDEVDVLYDRIMSFLSGQPFDPAAAHRTFVIAASDYAILLMAGPMLAAIAEAAPHVNIQFVQVSDSVSRQIAAREVDLALIPAFYLEAMPPGHLSFQPIFREPLVILFRQGHSLSKHALVTKPHLDATRLVQFNPGFTSAQSKRLEIFQYGGQFEIAAFVPQVTLLPHLLLGTDLAAIVPQGLARRMKAMMPLEFRPLSFMTHEIETGLAWSRIQDSNPAHSWLREVTAQSGAAVISSH